LPISHVVYKASGAHSLFLELAQKPLPHIIFMDINMPQTNGIDCLRRLKNDPQYNNIPVLMYSISNRDTDIDDSYRAGAHYYVVKAHVPANLPASLRKALMPDWREPQPLPKRDGFVIDLTYGN
ncbi:MAG: response regulator, partial [Bacteroidota bacterium]